MSVASLFAWSLDEEVAIRWSLISSISYVLKVRKHYSFVPCHFAGLLRKFVSTYINIYTAWHDPTNGKLLHRTTTDKPWSCNLPCSNVLRIYPNLSSIQSFRKPEICQHHLGLWHNATWAFKLTLAT